MRKKSRISSRLSFWVVAPLTPEESVAALHRLGAALAHSHDHHGTDRLHDQLNRRIAVAGEVLDAGSELVRVSDPRHGAVVADSQQDFASQRIGQRHNLAGERGRQTLFKLQSRAFTLLEQDLEIGPFHRWKRSLL